MPAGRASLIMPVTANSRQAGGRNGCEVWRGAGHVGQLASVSAAPAPCTLLAGLAAQIARPRFATNFPLRKGQAASSTHRRLWRPEMAHCARPPRHPPWGSPFDAMVVTRRVLLPLLELRNAAVALPLLLPLAKLLQRRVALGRLLLLLWRCCWMRTVCAAGRTTHAPARAAMAAVSGSDFMSEAAPDFEWWRDGLGGPSRGVYCSSTVLAHAIGLRQALHERHRCSARWPQRTATARAASPSDVPSLLTARQPASLSVPGMLRNVPAQEQPWR